MTGPAPARVLSHLWMLAAAAAIIAVLALGKILFVPLGFAILFAFLLAPLVDLLERIRIGRLPAVLAVMLVFVLLLGGAGWTLFTQLVEVANDLPTYRDNITQKMAAIHRPSNSAYGRAEKEIEYLSNELGVANTTTAPLLHASDNPAKKPIGTTPEHPVQVREVGPPSGRLSNLGGVLEPLATALLTVVFTFFVLLQREDLRNRLIRLSGDRNVGMMTQAMDDASHRISRYFSLQLLVNTAYGSIIFLALHFIGLPHAMFFGALAGMARFVPYVGAPVAALIPTLLSLAVFHGWTRSLLIAGVFFCMEVITANFAEPRIYGKHTGLAPLAILIAAAFWTLLWGPVGLALSIPLTVCLVVMGRHIPSLEFLTVLLGDKPSIAPWTCLYQRLLARDGREAAEILESAVDHTSLEEAYDQVLVPALIHSEEDRLDDSLDQSMIRFIRRTARWLIEESGFRDSVDQAEQQSPSITSRHPLQQLDVLCIPVRDESDELAAAMLSQCLNNSHIKASAAREWRLNDILRLVETRKPSVVFLCGLPPVGMARTHRLYRTIRARNPRLPVLMGIWDLRDDADEVGRQATGDEQGRVITSLKEAVQTVRALGSGVALVDPAEEQAAAGRDAADRDAADQDAADRDAEEDRDAADRNAA